MVVSRRPHRVASFDDIRDLFQPVSPSTSKEINMTSASTASAAQTASTPTEVNELITQAMEQMRNARSELGQQVADAAAAAKVSFEKVEDVTQKVTKIEAGITASTDELKRRIHDLEAAAKAASGKPAVKQPVYKRALDVAQQIGGVAAFAGGIGFGAKLAYDRFTGNGDNAEA